MTTEEIIKQTFPKILDEELYGINELKFEEKTQKQFKNINNPYDFLDKYLKLKNPTTLYRDGKIQCCSLKRRSFCDLYAIVRMKFNNLSIEEFAYLLLSCASIADNDIYISFCSSVKKIVVRQFSDYDIKASYKLNENGFFVPILQNYHYDIDLYIKQNNYIPRDDVYESKILKLANNYILNNKEKLCLNYKSEQEIPQPVH